MVRSRSHYLIAIGLLALAAFAVRAVSLNVQPLWRDEVDALRFATVPWPEMLSTFTRPGWNGPLYFLLLRGWVALAGTSEYALRFFSLAFGVLCMPLVYALGHRLFNRPVGFLAALLATTSPYLAWYSQEVKMYTLVPALVLLAVYGLRRAVEGEGYHWWAVQVVATSLAFYSHIWAALLIPIQVLLSLAWWPQTRRQWGGALVSLACLTLPYLPLAVWQAPLALQTRETGFYPYALDEMAEILLNGWSAGMDGWGLPWGAVLMGALAMWGLASPLVGIPYVGQVANLSHARTKGLEDRLALVCWLVTPLLVVWLISLRQPLFTDRYLIWAALAFYLLVALGLASLRCCGGWGRWAVVLLVTIILVFNGANLWRQATVPTKADFRAAAAYVAGYRTPDAPIVLQAPGADYPFKWYLPLVMSDHRAFGELIIFQIPYGRYTFDYYFPMEKYPWGEGLYTNHRVPDGSYLMSEQEAAYRMQEMTAGYNTVWLVATEMEMWDERGLVQAWLEANARRVDEAHFTRVDVYRYVK